ncbi:MAG: site-specific integrase [Chloroflexi bacterium]|nr:site-specific integrase [Chloroflexota bacterium]
MALAREAAQQLVARCRAERSPVAALAALLLASGLRLGEALALTGADVDLPRGVLRVRATLGPDGQRQPPKTPSAVRTVPLAPLGREALTWLPRPLATERWWRWSPGAARQAVARLARRAGLAPVCPHVLRHTHASLALAGGAPLAEVSRVLGHASVAITAGTYAHSLGEPQRVAAALAAALGEAQ